MKKEEKKISFIDVVVRWTEEDWEERKPIFDSIADFALKEIRDDDFREMLDALGKANKFSLRGI